MCKWEMKDSYAIFPIKVEKAPIPILISQKVNKIGSWYCQNKNDDVKTINVA